MHSNEVRLQIRINEYLKVVFNNILWKYDRISPAVLFWQLHHMKKSLNNFVLEDSLLVVTKKQI